jgi:DNA mismatch endonuclease (patch repair protein)
VSDVFDTVTRAQVMRSVKAKHTRPELRVRKIVTALGYRYRLHRADLPGNPDLAFVGKRKAIFVQGCFWHGHPCKRGARMPKANAQYWRAKIARTIARDQANRCVLAGLGWSVLDVWECELLDEAGVRERVSNFLGEGSAPKIKASSAPGRRPRLAPCARVDLPRPA